MPMIDFYIRVSSHTQKSDSQRAEIQRWLEAHKHALDTVQWFEDTETGATLTRSGLNCLQEAIFAGTVNMG
jgi:DNA invertase Pin-like site-specific DNA recombinase